MPVNPAVRNPPWLQIESILTGCLHLNFCHDSSSRLPHIFSNTLAFMRPESTNPAQLQNRSIHI